MRGDDITGKGSNNPEEWEYITGGRQAAENRTPIGSSSSGITAPPPLRKPLADEPLPYIRPIVVTVSAKGLKPNTRVYPYFDGQAVSSNCQLTRSGAFGAALKTDSKGSITFYFVIPPRTFKTGSRTFVITNSSTNPDADTDCRAVSEFVGMASITYDGTKTSSTRTLKSTFSKIIRPRSIDVERFVSTNPSGQTFKDPIAQTFFVSGELEGIFVTKIDVYFKSRPTDGNVPITLQLRETVNGNPSQNIIPLSTVTLFPKDVNVSTDASAPTKFIFTSPVHLKNNEEYAMVLLPAGGNTSYEVWTAELGQNKLGTNEVIDKQPSAGRLYLSSNSINWTPSDTKDIKFTVYNANFSPSSGTLVLENKDIDYLQIANESASLQVGDFINNTTRTGTGEVIAYDTFEDVAQVLVTSGSFVENDEIEAGAVSGVYTKTATVLVNNPYSYGTSMSGRNFHLLHNAIGHLDFNDTNIVFAHKLRNVAGTLPSTYKTFGKRGMVEIGSEKGVFSASSGTGKNLFQLSLSTNKSTISPVVDLEKAAVLTYAYDIRNIRKTLAGTLAAGTGSATVTGTSTAFIDQVSVGSALRDTAGKVIGVVKSIESATSLTLTRNAALTVDATNEICTVDYEASDIDGNAKYHTKTVQLPSGQESDDIIVFLDADMPEKTDVRVYVKLQARGDRDPRYWTLMNKTINKNTLGAGEFVYKLSKNGHDENTQIGGINSSGVFEYEDVSGNAYTQFGTFQIKIVMLSSDTYIKPTIYALRALALMA